MTDWILSEKSIVIDWKTLQGTKKMWSSNPKVDIPLLLLMLILYIYIILPGQKSLSLRSSVPLGVLRADLIVELGLNNISFDELNAHTVWVQSYSGFPTWFV